MQDGRHAAMMPRGARGCASGVQHLQERCVVAPEPVLAAAGFDIVHRFDAHRVARELGLDALADPARPLGLLVGNTRALWPRFVAARAADPMLASDPDPVDRYTEQTIARVLASLDGIAVFAHRRHGERFLPFQRIAVAAGLAALAPTQLLIHPSYGPWLALRAIISCPGAPVFDAARASLPCACDATCLSAFTRAQAATGPDAWRAWLAVRDACPIGREHRYGESQLEYHYTKDRALLGGRTGT
jgi:cyanocobalamin reductase (cyanide-eliminating) / alkylcobalamin dealkylase